MCALLVLQKEVGSQLKGSVINDFATFVLLSY